MTNVFRSLTGIYEVELTAADPGETFTHLGRLGITVRELQYTDALTCCFSVSRNQYPMLRDLAHKSGWTLRILRRRGLFWKLYGLRARPVLIAGLLTFLILWTFVPGRILLIEVQGNIAVPSRQILEAAENCGIRFGTRTRIVRSERIKNALLAELPQLSWAGINTYGSRAVITVRERETDDMQEEQKGISSIVACRDGIISEITVTRGSGLVVPGEAVRRGQVLISGYTDHGLVLEAARAEGEIMGLTKRQITAKMPLQRKIRTKQTGQMTKYSLLVGKKRINLYFGSGIYGGTCVKMCDKYVLRLPGGYAMPFALIRETAVEYGLSDDPISADQAELLLKEFADRYLNQQMIAGKILHRRETLCPGPCMTLSGSYDCQEMIGRTKAEEIGVYHGKTD